MADKSNSEMGFRQTYKQTGNESSGGGPKQNIDPGPAGSHRDNNWKIGAAQSKMRNAGKIGPGKNLKDIDGGNFY